MVPAEPRDLRRPRARPLGGTGALPRGDRPGSVRAGTGRCTVARRLGRAPGQVRDMQAPYPAPTARPARDAGAASAPPPPIHAPTCEVLERAAPRAGGTQSGSCAVRDPSLSPGRAGPRGLPVRFETTNSRPSPQPGAVISTLPPCLNLYRWNPSIY